MSSFGLRDSDWNALIDVLRAHSGVEKVAIFGSRARGAFRPASDVDLCIFGSSLTLGDLATLHERLEELPIPQRVDLVLEHLIDSDALRSEIERDGRVVWELSGTLHPG